MDVDMYIMPWTKEKTAEYNKAYYHANMEKAAERNKAYRLANKEEIAEHRRVYRLENHEALAIKSWRHQGHIIPAGTEHAAYVRFSETTHCEFCGWELVDGSKRKTNTKCRHHDHTIEGEDNFIAIICHICNLREKCTNTSGEPNIYYVKETAKWLFRINYCGKDYSKYGFKSFEEALVYKGAWLALNSPNAFHDPSWNVELP